MYHDFDKQYNVLSSLFKKYPVDKYVRFNAGIKAIHSNRDRIGIEILDGFDLDKLNFETGRDLQIFSNLIKGLHKQGEYQRVIDLCQKYLVSGPAFLTHSIWVRSLVRLKEMTLVENLLTKINNEVGLVKNHKAACLNSVGHEFLKMGDAKSAAPYFKRALDINPYINELHQLQRNQSLLWSGRHKQGISELEDKLPVMESKDPSGVWHSLTANQLVYHYAAIGNFEKAAYFRQLRDAYPNRFKKYFYKTDAYVELQNNNIAAAVEYLKKGFQAGLPFHLTNFQEDVMLLPLHGYPAFDEFVKMKEE
ncbi:MAG: hypothetical protein R3250_15165 [Melioribacteraceae bacterium]|nr:hypothetical protein [Melioribacteraceae bacterium]